MLNGILHNSFKGYKLKNVNTLNELTGSIIRNNKVIATLPDDCNTRLFKGGDNIVIDRDSSTPFPSTYLGFTPKGWDYYPEIYGRNKLTGGMNTAYSQKLYRVFNYFPQMLYSGDISSSNSKGVSFGIKWTSSANMLTIKGTSKEQTDNYFAYSGYYTFRPSTTYRFNLQYAKNTNNSVAQFYLKDITSNTVYTTPSIITKELTSIEFTTPSDLTNVDIRPFIILNTGTTYDMECYIGISTNEVDLNIISKPWWNLSLSAPNGLNGAINTPDITGSSHIHPNDYVDFQYESSSDNAEYAVNITNSNGDTIHLHDYSKTYRNSSLKATLNSQGSMTFTITETTPDLTINLPTCIQHYNGKNVSKALNMYAEYSSDCLTNGQKICTKCDRMFDIDDQVYFNINDGYVYLNNAYGLYQDGVVKVLQWNGDYGWSGGQTIGTQGNFNFFYALKYGEINSNPVTIKALGIRECLKVHVEYYENGMANGGFDNSLSSYLCGRPEAFAFIKPHSQKGWYTCHLKRGETKKVNGYEVRFVGEEDGYNHLYFDVYRDTATENPDVLVYVAMEMWDEIPPEYSGKSYFNYI